MKQYAQHSDKELFLLISKGNEGAFTEVYLRYVEKLYPHVRRLLDAESWAEEIIQEVFTKLWQIREGLVNVDNPSAYLYRMAANRTLDFLKHRAIEAKVQYKIARHSEETAKSDTEAWVDFRHTEKLYQEAIQRLPSQKQLIFRMRHEQGMSYEDIAEQLKLSKSTVRNQLTRAMDSIRNFLLSQGTFGFLLTLLHAACCSAICRTVEAAILPVNPLIIIK